MEKDRFLGLGKRFFRRNSSEDLEELEPEPGGPLNATEPVARNFARLIMRSVTVEELGDPRFTVTSDGVPALRVSRETIEAIDRATKRK